MKKGHVVVALSGGVDSAVAAALLLEQGYQVSGATLHLWSPPGESEEQLQERFADPRAICQQLGITHHLLDRRDQFRRTIVDEFLQEYLQGHTPNPCVVCNREIKWRFMLALVEELGADLLATGHYARLLRQGEQTQLARALHTAKDQSYALWNLPLEALRQTLFPLGELAKSETRRLAANLNLPVKDNPESQDICFIPEGDYGNFLRDQYPREMAAVQPGPIQDESGNIIGRHRGIPYYTIGQRKGLGIALGQPHFISAIDAKANAITITTGEGLFRCGLRAGRVNWQIPPPQLPFHAFARIRYHDPGADCLITPLTRETVEVRFDTARRAITPGQSVVFYQNDVVLGGGIIGESFE
ncbi:MAG: tRNA 2-thiouridine(34) synthase MnmA [Candidatus Delongbacteria bacterium]|nr:tRNA 2-thiouridine(34) synthase MnmA [Candidatus Delongbacteria bacterium]